MTNAIKLSLFKYRTACNYSRARLAHPVLDQSARAKWSHEEVQRCNDPQGLNALSSDPSRIPGHASFSRDSSFRASSRAAPNCINSAARRAIM